jgi:hypothetical protein
MTVPLPTAETVNLEPPDAPEVQFTAQGVAAAIAPADGLTDGQRLLIEALFPAMTGHAVDVSTFAPVTAEQFAEGLARRDLQFRTRGVQLMLLGALVLRPLPDSVVDRFAEFARALGVDDGMIPVARRFASGSLGLAAVDFERNGYTATWSPGDAAALHTSEEIRSAWDSAIHDPALAARWEALQHLPEGTLGRSVWQLYRARAFEFPGRPGSAPPLLSQHDWVHVLADYGTTVEAELEVFAFIARANDDMRAFSLLAMVVSLFETGYLRTGANLFEYHPGHLTEGVGVARRMADAMRRGALCTDSVTGSDSIDYLRIDWFALADQPLDAVRARFGVVAQAADALAAGSVGPWEPGGISPFQLAAGRAAADERAEPYDSFGADAIEAVDPRT